MRTLQTTTAFVLSSMAAVSLQAAPAAWTSATTTGADPMTGNSTLTSFTTADGTFTDFTYATSGTLVSGASTPTDAGGIAYTDGARNYWSSGGSETDGAAAVFDGRLDSGIVAHGVYDYKFAGPISVDDYVFFAELGLGDPDTVTINPLDSGGNLIGSYALTTTGTEWGLTVALGAGWMLDALGAGEEAADSSNNNQQLAGVTFQLSDFAGDSLSLDGTVHGLRIDGGGTFDPALLGTAAVPEPATVGLIGLGILACGMSRRRKA